MTNKGKIEYNEYQEDKLIDGEAIALSVDLSGLRLKENQDFIQYAKENQWENRRDFESPWPWRADVFDFIRKIYAAWLPTEEQAKERPGGWLVQSDLKAVDEPLWKSLQKRLQMEPLPADLYLPKESDARLHSMQDDVEKAALLKIREWDRVRKKAARARAPSGP